MGLIYQGDRLFFGEKNPADLVALAQQFGSPFYVYDLDGMRERAHALLKAIPGIEAHYAMKANGARPVLENFLRQGLGVDVVSGGEIKTALAAGFKPKDIIFSGVGKTKEELGLAIGLGIKQINIESPGELKRILEIARTMKLVPDLAFRINPDVDAKTHPYITTGFRENKFGMGEHFFPELMQLLRANPGSANLVGLTMHIGSQIQDLKPMEDALVIGLEAFRSFQREGFPLKTLDIGGGLGISYADEHTIPGKDFSLLEGYGAMVRRVLKDFEGRILCEPGRILVGSRGTLVGEVQYVKETPFRNFLILNTGMHHLLRPTLYQAVHRALPLLKTNRPSKTYDLVGPICESSDVLGKERVMPTLLEGEFLAFADAGAYGMSMASNYNEHPMPKELFWDAGKLV